MEPIDQASNLVADAERSMTHWPSSRVLAFVQALVAIVTATTPPLETSVLLRAITVVSQHCNNTVMKIGTTIDAVCRLDHCLNFLAEIFIHIEQDVLQLSLPPSLVSLQGLAIATG